MVTAFILIALAVGVAVAIKARKKHLSWLSAGGGGFLAAFFSFAALSALTGASKKDEPPSPELQSAQQQQPAQADTAIRKRCVNQAKEQNYRSGQCAYTFIDTCIRTQSRKEMEAVLRADGLLGIGQSYSCPNMPSTFVADFDKF